jgi:hypothetical protein
MAEKAHGETYYVFKKLLFKKGMKRHNPGDGLKFCHDVVLFRGTMGRIHFGINVRKYTLF